MMTWINYENPIDFDSSDSDYHHIRFMRKALEWEFHWEAHILVF